MLYNDNDGLTDKHDTEDCPESPGFILQYPLAPDEDTGIVPRLPDDLPVTAPAGAEDTGAVPQGPTDDQPTTTSPEADTPTPAPRGFVTGIYSGNTIGPGTATRPGAPYSDEDEAGEKCGVTFVIIPLPYCLELLSESPPAPQIYDDEICMKGVDDDGDGSIDEDPYCSVNSQSGPKCSPDSGFFVPQDPTAQPVKIPKCPPDT